MTPAAPVQPALIDLIQAQILAFGWCVIGSRNKYNQGEIIKFVRRSDVRPGGEEILHPFSIVGLATEDDIAAMEKLMRELFPNCSIPPRPDRYWYRCVTD